MKKIISVDLHVLQELNKPNRLNINRLTELKTYIEDSDYQVFIYITRLLENRTAYFKQLKNHNIIDTVLGREAKVIDFSRKEERQNAKLHVQFLKEKISQISEFIAIGLPQDRRFIWLQKIGASIVDGDNLANSSLVSILNEQLSVEALSPEIEASYSYKKQPHAPLRKLAYEHSPRYKRALIATTMPPPADFYQMIVEQNAQIMDKLNFLRDLLEEENIMPQIFSLKSFHIVHSIFDAGHFIAEIISIIMVYQHLKHSASNNSHRSTSSITTGNTIIPIALDMRMESEKEEANPFREKEVNDSEMHVYQRTFRREPRKSKMVISAKLGEIPASENKTVSKKEQEAEEKQEKSASSSKCGGFFCCFPCCRKETKTMTSEHVELTQAKSFLTDPVKSSSSESSTQTRPAEVKSTQTSSVASSQPNSCEQTGPAAQIDSSQTCAASTSSQPPEEPVKPTLEASQCSPKQAQAYLKHIEKKVDISPKRSSKNSESEKTPLKSTSRSSIPKVNYQATASYFNLNQNAVHQQAASTQEVKAAVLTKSSAC